MKLVIKKVQNLWHFALNWQSIATMFGCKCDLVNVEITFHYL